MGRYPLCPNCVLPRDWQILEKVNYRKLRIGAGNRINAEVALEGGRGRVPTTQDAAVEFQVLLVGSMPASTGRFFPRTSGSDDRLQRRERDPRTILIVTTHTHTHTHANG